MDYQEKSSKLVHFLDPKANLPFRMGHPPPVIISKINSLIYYTLVLTPKSREITLP